MISPFRSPLAIVKCAGHARKYWTGVTRNWQRRNNLLNDPRIWRDSSRNDESLIDAPVAPITHEVTPFIKAFRIVIVPTDTFFVRKVSKLSVRHFPWVLQDILRDSLNDISPSLSSQHSFERKLLLQEIIQSGGVEMRKFFASLTVKDMLPFFR